jgi:hypothetical protein
MKKQVTIFLLTAALLAAAVAFTGCGSGGGENTGNTNIPAKLGGTWRVYHTPNGQSESPADTWSITPEPGNDAVISIWSSGSGTTFNGTVYKMTITASLPDSSDTVTMTGTVVTVTDAMIGSTMSGTYSSTSGETGTWRGANLAYVTLQSFEVTPAVTNVVVGNTRSFTATAVYSDGYTDNVTGSATWSSLPLGNMIATVSGGVATGLSVGYVTITASLSNVGSGAAALQVTSGYTLASLSGAWLVDSTVDRDAGYDFFISNGSGNITSDTFYSASGANTYSVQSNGAFTLTITPITGPPTFDITGTLTSSTAGTLEGVGPNSTISKVSDLTLCQGAWTGALSTGYALAFTIKSDGTLDTAATRTITGGTITSGAMVGQGDLCVGYFTTTAANPYNAFRINGTLVTGATTTMTGNFDNDSSTAWPVGTVSLTK